MDNVGALLTVRAGKVSSELLPVACRIILITIIIIIAYAQTHQRSIQREEQKLATTSRPESRIPSLCSARSRIGSLRGASSQTTIIEHGNNDWQMVETYLMNS